MAFHESVELGPGKKSGTCWIREGNMADARMPGDPREKGGQRSLVVIVDRGILLEKEGSNLMDRSNSKIFNSFRPSFIFCTLDCIRCTRGQILLGRSKDFRSRVIEFYRGFFRSTVQIQKFSIEN